MHILYQQNHDGLDERVKLVYGNWGNVLRANGFNLLSLLMFSLNYEILYTT